MQAFAGGFTMGAQPCADQNLKYCVPHMGQADGADRPQFVVGQGRFKVIHHSFSSYIVCDSERIISQDIQFVI